ncbi:hypothetical protein J6590_036730 [Homalodisca vitripennis]|nr:hypothetical protein J6590_036730 [Homalodisca vitripennis]
MLALLKRSNKDHKSNEKNSNPLQAEKEVRMSVTDTSQLSGNSSNRVISRTNELRVYDVATH